MSGTGEGVQIVNVKADHSYESYPAALRQILLKDEVQDLPVAVVSVAGAFRTGKSFLLNFFLRYLHSPHSDRENGSWLGENSEPLVGFRWRGGVTRTTTGILMWSEPFIITKPSGDKVAVVLIDTQGTFDSKSTVRDNSTIFALSTLLSSVQIYNVSQNVQEDDLQNLQLFAAYGKLVQHQGSKAFQVLEFLVRDWQFFDDYPYGLAGGEQFLQEMLKTDLDLPQSMKDLRIDLKSSFEKLSCFLMPHPGFKVLAKKYQGNIAEIDANFRAKLIELVNSIFGPDKLLPKVINGEQVKAKDLISYFEAYMALFTSDEIPNTTSIMQATVEAGFLTSVSQAREIYEKNMDAEIGPSQLCVPSADVPEIHKKYLEKAKKFFTDKKKMGSQEEAKIHLDKLIEELEKRLEQFEQSNNSKYQTALKKSQEAYDAAINKVRGVNSLCVHPQDLEEVHNRGIAAATKVFDDSRKPVGNKEDPERNAFLSIFEKLYDSLRETNEQNNKSNVAYAIVDYSTNIQAKATLDPPLSMGQLKNEHESLRNKAVDLFESKRNVHVVHNEDVHKFQMIKKINDVFNIMKELNGSKNAKAVSASFDVYKGHMDKVWNMGDDLCLHPIKLQKDHESGLCVALNVLRPNRSCTAGADTYDDSDGDEMTLKRLIVSHYDNIKTLNDSLNESASTKAYNTYKNMMAEKMYVSAWWILTTVIGVTIAIINKQKNYMKYHNESKKKALEVFDSQRRGDTQYTPDVFRDNLTALIDAHKRE